jgi:hypothetical protein
MLSSARPAPAVASRRPAAAAADDARGDGVADEVEALRAVAALPPDGGAGFQSVAVAAVQILERAASCECTAAQAALSLGQREKLSAMAEAAREAVRILRGTLSTQGARVMDLCAETPAPDDDPDWERVLARTRTTLARGAEQMASLTAAQPCESPARALSRATARLLHAHHDALVQEARQWIS